MKFINYYFIATFLIIGLSCDSILDVPAKNAVGEDVLADEDGINVLLIGAYAALDAAGFNYTYSEAAPNDWLYGSVVGGESHSGGSGGGPPLQNPIANGHSIPSMRFFDSKWRADFEGVARANSVLQLIDNVESISDNAKHRYAAEARFLRGHYYFNLKKMFNNVPWVDENTDDKNQPNSQDIWPLIEEDFEFAMENLPSIQSDRGRANNWAAASYLAKVYMFQEKWAQAKELYDNIIVNGNTSQGISYDLTDEFGNNYRPSYEDGNSEVVFSIQQVANDASGGGINNANGYSLAQYPAGGPFPCCSYNQPTQDMVNAFRTNENGLPFLDSYNETHVTNDLNIAPDQQFEPYSGFLDPRLDWTVGRRGVPYHDWGPHPGRIWVNDPTSFNVYHGKKHIYWSIDEEEYADLSSWGPASAINIHVIRFADVLLMAAEAEVHLGNIEKAREYVNRVRNRASNPSGMVNNNLNRYNASDVVATKHDLTGLSSVSPRDWVVVEEDNTTYVYLGGGYDNLNNWNRYEEPNYRISEYSQEQWDSINPLDAIRFERRLELAMEGHRFFDLVRWGIADEVLNRFFDYKREISNTNPQIGGNARNNGIFTPNKNEYYPIPQNQIDLSVVDGKPVLQQNPGYN